MTMRYNLVYKVSSLIFCSLFKSNHKNKIRFNIEEQEWRKKTCPTKVLFVSTEGVDENLIDLDLVSG